MAEEDLLAKVYQHQVSNVREGHRVQNGKTMTYLIEAIWLYKGEGEE
jgi:hypothetical protein